MWENEWECHLIENSPISQNFKHKSNNRDMLHYDKLRYHISHRFFYLVCTKPNQNTKLWIQKYIQYFNRTVCIKKRRYHSIKNSHRNKIYQPKSNHGHIMAPTYVSHRFSCLVWQTKWNYHLPPTTLPCLNFSLNNMCSNIIKRCGNKSEDDIP